MASFQVLNVVSVKMAACWVVAPCFLVEVHHFFPRLSIALMMEAVMTSETVVNFYQTTRRYNPEGRRPRI
jgi:hypothetical protein